MSSIAAPAAPDAAARPVASVSHTLRLAAIFLIVAVGGAIAQQRAAAHGHDLPAAPNAALVYLPLIAIEWGLVLYIVRGGLRPAGVSWRELVGGRWSSWRDVATDLLLGVGTWGAWKLVEQLWMRVSGPDHVSGPAARIRESLL